MFPTANNFSQFTRSQVARFMDKQELQPFTQNQKPPTILGMTEDEESNALQTGGGGSFGGGSGGRKPSIGMGGGGIGFSISFSGDGRVKDQDAEQIVDVNYGHNGSGKVYSYKAKGAAVGKPVTAMVTHYKSKRDFKTLAVIRRVQSSEDVGGEDGVNERRAEKKLAGISLKTIDTNDMNQYAPIRIKRRGLAGRLGMTKFAKTKSGRVKKELIYSPKSQLPGWKKQVKAIGAKQKTPTGLTHAQISNAWRRDSKIRHGAN